MNKSLGNIATFSLLFIVGLTTTTVDASFYRISWVGYMEPLGDENPWGLMGDGALLSTPADGTPFSMSIDMNSAALDFDDTLGNIAQYTVDAVFLTIGGVAADAGDVTLYLVDDFSDMVDRVYDGMGILGEVTFFGIPSNFGMTLRFDPFYLQLLDDPLPDVFPMLPNIAYTSITISTYSSDGIVAATVLADTQVTVGVVPLPGAIYLFTCSLFSLALKRYIS